MNADQSQTSVQYSWTPLSLGNFGYATALTLSNGTPYAATWLVDPAGDKSIGALLQLNLSGPVKMQAVTFNNPPNNMIAISDMIIYETGESNAAKYAELTQYNLHAGNMLSHNSDFAGAFDQICIDVNGNIYVSLTSIETDGHYVLAYRPIGKSGIQIVKDANSNDGDMTGPILKLSLGVKANVMYCLWSDEANKVSKLNSWDGHNWNPIVLSEATADTLAMVADHNDDIFYNTLNSVVHVDVSGKTHKDMPLPAQPNGATFTKITFAHLAYEGFKLYYLVQGTLTDGTTTICLFIYDNGQWSSNLVKAGTIAFDAVLFNAVVSNEGLCYIASNEPRVWCGMLIS